jgi:putative peptidoglycan lipid II flippase
LAVYLHRLIFPFLFFIGLSALAMAILNSMHIFALPAATPILFNVAIIVCSFGVVYRPLMRLAPEPFRSPAVALAIGVMVGGALQFLVQVPELIRSGMRFVPSLSFSDPGIRRVSRLMLPGFFGIGIYEVNFFVDTIFATSAKMPRGSITSLYVADRVMELVLGAYAISVATAILPMMSHQAAAKEFDKLKSTLTFALRIVSFIAIPGAVGLVVLREPIIQVLFQHGRFAADSTALTARALLFYALGLPAFAGIKLIVPAFYSTHDTRTPVRVAAYALLLNIVLNTIFLELFFSTLLNGSPALATSLSAYFNFFLLFWLFRQRQGRLGTRALLSSLAKILACSAAMALVCYAMMIWSGFADYQTLLPRIAMLGAMIGAGALVYLGLARLLRCAEMDEVFEILRKAEPEAAAAGVMPE